MRAAVGGTGFIGAVHVDALRKHVVCEKPLADAFRELYAAVYADVERGGSSAEPDCPTFRDGHAGNVLCDAVALSNREQRWVEVPV